VPERRPENQMCSSCMIRTGNCQRPVPTFPTFVHSPSATPYFTLIMGKPLAASSTNTLDVRDNRTGKTYTIPYGLSALIGSLVGRAKLSVCRIVNNTVPATAFKDIKAPRQAGEREENATEKGLRVSDKGFLNTAVITSEITYIDGEAGGSSLKPLDIHMRSHAIQCFDTGHSIVPKSVFTPHLNLRLQRIPHRAARRALVLSRDGVPPHLRQPTIQFAAHHVRERGPPPWRDALGLCRVLPRFPVRHLRPCRYIGRADLCFSYDAHPMAMMTSAFAYLGSYYSEANPSLQGVPSSRPALHSKEADCLLGQTLFTKGDKPSLAVLDKQIFRLIGKATTLAACVPCSPSTVTGSPFAGWPTASARAGTSWSRRLA
jgi:citrate synthase